MIDFTDLTYLRSGNDKQRQVYTLLLSNRIIERLAGYTPILTGTIPIGVDIDSSDLDIICYAKNLSDFQESLSHHFGNEQNFKITFVERLKAVKANFLLNGFELEIFGQNIPTTQQHAYQHLMIEHKILQTFGEEFRLAIIELKKQGYKTEPAFARILGLPGDPYEALLRVEL